MGKYMTFDVGTTAIKTCIFGEDLQRIDSSTDEYDLITEDGHVELEPEKYWETIVKAVRAIGERNDLSDVRSICLTTQGETMIPVTADGKVLNRAVVWLDDRAGKEAAEIVAVLDEMAKEKDPSGNLSGLSLLFRTTGIPEMNGLVPLAKLLWFKEQAPEIFEKADKFLLLEDYLIYRLTGRFVTEKSLATSTAWLDLLEDGYWEELLLRLGISPEKLPEAVECGTITGTLTASAGAELGLPETVQVVAGAMDQITAAIGGGGLSKDVVTATVGTAMVMTAEVSREKAFSDDAMVVYRGYKKGQYVLTPYTTTAGVVFKWLKDTVFPVDAKEAKAAGKSIYDVLCEMAGMVPAGAQGVTMIPYFQGSIRPKYVPEAKGIFFGLGLDSGREVLVRATLEGIGFMIRENLTMLEQYGVHAEKIQFFGGGSKNAVWNQIISDISSVELVKPCEEECASLGAAILAAVALGDRASVEEAKACNPVSLRVVPDLSKKPVYDAAYERYNKIFDAVSPLF